MSPSPAPRSRGWAREVGQAAGTSSPGAQAAAGFPSSGFPAHSQALQQVALGDRQPPAPVRDGHGVG